MSKYIRTKDGILDTKLLIKCNDERIENGWFTKNGVPIIAIEQADTIEELCDEFVFDGGDDTPLLCTYEELKYWFNHSKEQQYKIRNCYGAIWTNKGLIYVTKLKIDGDWELI